MTLNNFKYNFKMTLNNFYNFKMTLNNFINKFYINFNILELLYMEINWINYVDHIYCVSFTQNAKTRIPLLYNELEFIDIHKNDEIFSIYYNISPSIDFFKGMYDMIPNNGALKQYFGYGENVRKTFAHYKCIREAYELGYEHILVIEDDILILKWKDAILTYLNNMPKDYDLILFSRYGLTIDSEFYNDYFQNMFYTDENGVYYMPFCASTYFMSKSGMKKWLDTFESKYMTIDFWGECFNNKDKCYVTNHNLTIQYNDMYVDYSYEFFTGINFNIEEYGGKRELEFHLNILKWCVDKILYADLEKYPEVKHYTETYFKSFIIFTFEGIYNNFTEENIKLIKYYFDVAKDYIDNDLFNEFLKKL